MDRPLIHRYLGSLGSVSPAAILADWQWAFEGLWSLLAVTKMGDGFVVDSLGRVKFLDTLEGQAREAASTIEDFRALLERGTHDDDWFLPGFVDSMERQGQILEPGQCYSFKVPPVLGGPTEVSNLQVISTLVHFSMAGQLHEQVRRMPQGTRISGFELIE